MLWFVIPTAFFCPPVGQNMAALILLTYIFHLMHAMTADSFPEVIAAPYMDYNEWVCGWRCVSMKSSQ